MLIEIIRKRSNHLYTEGELHINDKNVTFTVEATEVMLPAGTYMVLLGKNKKNRRAICVYHKSLIYPSRRQPPPFTIGIGHSWIGSKKNSIICIGQPLIPGAVYKATEIYNRIFDRIEKCVDRGESITLEISDKQIHESQPISHWLQVQP